jgi:hypothetical protein
MCTTLKLKDAKDLIKEHKEQSKDLKESLKDIKDGRKDTKDIKEKDLKDAVKDHKEKDFKEKDLKDAIKDRKELKEFDKPVKEFDKPGKEVAETGPIAPGQPIQPRDLEQRLAELEQTIGQLTAFISSSMRPDLSGSALGQEPDCGCASRLEKATADALQSKANLDVKPLDR